MVTNKKGNKTGDKADTATNKKSRWRMLQIWIGNCLVIFLSWCFFNFWLRSFSMLFSAFGSWNLRVCKPFAGFGSWKLTFCKPFAAFFWSWHLSLWMLFATFYIWNFPFRMLFAAFGGWNLPFCKPCAAVESWNRMILAFVCNILELESSSGMLFTSCCCRLLAVVC